MDPIFEDLMAVDSNTAFNFFSVNIRETVESRTKYRVDEMLYVTSILAHYSQVSRVWEESMPVLADLTDFFEFFVKNAIFCDRFGLEFVEMAGSQVVLFAGFFRDQMRHRHNVRWYDQIGQSMFDKLAGNTRDIRRRELFGRLTESLPMWLRVCRDTHRRLLENRFLLKIQ